ncbi:MAG: hypothetical protein ACI8RZ_002944 [Myxococcota bacterium]|jgi:hypothetical protein
MRTILFTIIGLGVPAAYAQETTAEAPDPQLATLTAELEAARVEIAGYAEASVQLDALIAAASILTDAAATEVDKLAAVGQLADIGDARAAPFLALAAERESPAVKRALLAAAPLFSDDSRIHLMVVGLLDPTQPEAVRLDALIALDDARIPQAPEILMDLAGSRSESETIKAAAAAQLASNHAEFLAAQGGILEEAAPLSAAASGLFAVTSGVTGTLLLSSVGKLGQTDAGPVIGGLGGALIGTGVGLVYARSNAITLEQALQYATATGTGMIYGGQIAAIANVNTPLYLLTAGSTVGAATGLIAMSRLSPTQADISETVGAMTLGNMAFSGAARWGGASNEARIGLGMAGQSLGIASGLFLRDAVDFDGHDGTLIASAGMVGGWLGSVAPVALERTDNIGGIVQTAIPTAMLAASAVSQTVEIPAGRILAADFGFGAGNLLGVGLPLLLVESPDGTLVTQGVLAGGLVGLVAGGALSSEVAFSGGDASLTGVGTALLTAESAALSYVLSEKTGFDREGGLILTTAGASLAGLGLASQFVDVEPSEPLLVASAAGWGVFYGGLIPVALGLEGQPEDLVLAVTVTSDLFMAAAAISQTDAIDLSPRATILPQLGGVGGAVIGTLGTALFVPDPQSVTAGALVGSMAGVAVGIGLERRYGSEWLPRAERLPTVRLASQPAVIDSEEAGMTFGFAVEGW